MAESEHAFHPIEVEFRRRHGIPGTAEHVLIFAESSHWDPNWLHTSEEYYQRYVDSNLLQAIAELQKAPRRVYSIECMFFLRLFWERHPELHTTIRSLVQTGRLRITSTGISSADTLLPSAEAILRELLLGQEWLRANGIEIEPALAYFPDCFGHTPALPSLLNAAGFTMTAFARLDGMHGMGSDYDPKSSYPRPGSSAEIFLKREKTLDFIWQAADDSQVLAHWNAFSYGQGDMIAYRGLMRMYIFPSYMYAEDRSDARVAHRIQEYVQQLAPLSRTPYLFCPIGMDFIPPVPDLLDLLDGYNQRHFPKTGVWVMNAGLQDYLELVSCYRQRLPVVALDPNPYWTGFYTSRPALKQRCHALLKELLRIEKLAVTSGLPHAASLDDKAIFEAWWAVGTSNHHDFITGTSPDAVVEGEQIPLLEQTIQSLRPISQRLAAQAAPKTSPSFAKAQNSKVKWERLGSPRDGTIQITTPHYGMEIDEKSGGCITRLWSAPTGEALLAGISNELFAYRESGGLWRMGMEYRGGKFKLAARSSSQKTPVALQQHPGAVELRTQVALAGSTFQLSILCRADSPWIRFRLTGCAPTGFTVCTRFQTGLRPRLLSMENPGGVADRPVHKIYQPTFWPVQRFCHVQDDQSQKGLAFLSILPGAVAYLPENQAIELVALRNATREKAYGFVPILACPAAGHEKEETTFQFALCFTSSGNWRTNRLPQIARDYERDPWLQSQSQDDPDLLWVSSDDVWLEALKPAWRGAGIIARLCSYNLPRHPVQISLPHRRISAAFECDLRERDLQPLEVSQGQLEVNLRKTITTLRLIIE